MRARQIIDGKLPCSSCKQLLPTDSFHRSSRAPSGFRNDCIACRRKKWTIPASKNRRIRKVVDGRQCCAICGEWKPEEKFELNKNCRNGRGNRCNACNVNRTIEAISRTPETFLRHFVRRHARNLNFRLIKKYSRKRHLWTVNCVTHEFLVELWSRQNGRCAVTGIPMTHRWGGNPPLTNVSIDRIDSDIGYVRENVRLVCKAVNLMKHEMSQQDLEFWSLAILEGTSPKGAPEPVNYW